MLFWEKSFEDQIEPFQTEMLSSFLSAINHNIKEMIANSSKGIKNIEMGNLIVIVTDIKSLGVEMVTISDSDNEKNIRKIIPEFIKILNENASLFKDFDGNMSVFEILDFKILQIIEKNKKILKKGKVLKEKLEIKEKGLPGQEGNKFVHEVKHPHYDKYTKFDEERKFLEDRLKETAALPKKIEILNSIDQIDHKLKEKPNIEKNKQRRKKFQVELQSTKERMKYFLEQTKQAINRSIQHSKGKLIYETDFKDAYLNLYSFSSKLKFIGRDDLCTKYREFAKILIEKPEDQERNFSNVIKKILDLSEDMESYFK
nr:hypothetical protein [Candidatus Prometheoarchaeum syntrophicum]QEE17819.1 hypothetical protein DSAG12_03657 [Candidatus Prometheoarchaeum syntrophicum]